MDIHVEERYGVRVAIEGCGHGTLHAIYASVQEACRQKDWLDVDLLIVGGDFQAVRNAYDLNCVNMPPKYRHMGDFHEYYSGKRTAPYLTIFVGGNHEASNYLFELYYGGWVAPNIYYMGAANVLRLGPLRIAGMSGIWKGYDYRKSHHERLPYNFSDVKSIYHVRELDVRKLLQIRTPVDVGISHDWPKGVEWRGNWRKLFKFKQFLQEDARSGQLGSTAAKYVMDWLRPNFWFSAHLHVKYSAQVKYEENSTPTLQPDNDTGNVNRIMNENRIDLEGADCDNLVDSAAVVMNEDEIDLDLDADADHQTNNKCSSEMAPPHVPTNQNTASTFSEKEVRAALPDSFRRPPPVEGPQRPPELTNKSVRFLALDKCLPGKHFLQLLDIPTGSETDLMRPLKLMYDREWLAITRAFGLYEPLVVGVDNTQIPRIKSQKEYHGLIDAQRAWIDQHLDDSAMIVPENFMIVAPVYDDGNWNLPQYQQATEYPSPQTDFFCQMLEMPNPFSISREELARRQSINLPPDALSNSSSHRGHGSSAKTRGRAGSFRNGRNNGRHRG